LWPTADQSGHIYFASDEANDEYNLYRIADGKKEQLTSFKESIGRPQVAADGSAVVFEKGYQVFLYNQATGKTTQPEIHLSRNAVLGKSSEFNVKGQISHFDISDDGKKMAFVS